MPRFRHRRRTRANMIRYVVCGCSRLASEGAGCALCGGSPEQCHITEETKVKLLAHAKELKVFGVTIGEPRTHRKVVGGLGAFGIALAITNSLDSGVLHKLIVYLRDIGIPKEQIVRLRLDEPEQASAVLEQMLDERPQISEQELRKALEQARHALVMNNGAVATDKPELFNFKEHPMAHWVIDNSDALTAIDRALG